jgi:hypothetical protein
MDLFCNPKIEVDLILTSERKTSRLVSGRVKAIYVIRFDGITTHTMRTIEALSQNFR